MNIALLKLTLVEFQYCIHFKQLLYNMCYDKIIVQ